MARTLENISCSVGVVALLAGLDFLTGDHVVARTEARHALGGLVALLAFALIAALARRRA